MIADHIKYREALSQACKDAGGSEDHRWNEQFLASLKRHGLALSIRAVHGIAYPDGVSYRAPQPVPAHWPRWPMEAYVVWESDVRADDASPNSILARLTGQTQDDEHLLPRDPVRHGLSFSPSNTQS